MLFQLIHIDSNLPTKFQGLVSTLKYFLAIYMVRPSSHINTWGLDQRRDNKLRRQSSHSAKPTQEQNESTRLPNMFFTSRLHNESAGARGYNFEAVKNNVSKIEEGLGALDELYIPINVISAHWNFIRV